MKKLLIGFLILAVHSIALEASSPQQNQKLLKLSPREELELELRHLHSLDLANNIRKLELEIRHLDMLIASNEPKIKQLQSKIRKLKSELRLLLDQIKRREEVVQERNLLLKRWEKQEQIETELRLLSL